MPDQFYLDLPGGQVVGDPAPEGGVSLYYSGRGGFRLDAEQAGQLADWVHGVRVPKPAVPDAPAPDASGEPAPLAPAAATPAVIQGGLAAPEAQPPAAASEEPPAAPQGAQDAPEALVTVQLTPNQLVRLRGLLDPVSEIRPEA
ncbi:MAG TPA: hypothetical protein VFC09_09795 [Candidatus Dormibacteraeota bacterium]|nr:hypothetical protein [Candidatus Dormibacteraeota bacterium]